MIQTKMLTGAFLTKLTIWLALASYAIATALFTRDAFASRARILWTLGCGLYLAHVVCAFGFFHHWSHADALQETARQTHELVGWDWGGGIFVNYLFTLVWLADVLWWWLAPASHGLVVPPLGGPVRPTREAERCGRTALVLIHGFFLFMVFNGTVIFGHGPVRWYGAVVCGVVVDSWLRKFCVPK